jgi:hypothetical protein
MSAITTGRIGEYLAAAVLEMYQWQTVIAPQAGFDIVATRGRRVYRCQVKASTIHNDTKNRLQWHFGIGGEKRLPTIKDYDFAALVSIPHRRVFFMPIENIGQKSMTRTASFLENKNIETETLTKTMEILNARLTEPPPVH